MDGPGNRCRLRRRDRRRLEHALCRKGAVLEAPEPPADPFATPGPASPPSPLGRSSARNLAFGARARQSSVARGGVPARAVDGNPNGSYSAASVTHTEAEPSPWLEVDLGAPARVEFVVIYNRTDCCAERLNGARLELSREPCDRRHHPPLAARPIPIEGHAVAARTVLSLHADRVRYVCLRGSGGEALSVAELEVYGHLREDARPPPSAPRPDAPDRPGRPRGPDQPARPDLHPAHLVGTYAARHPHWTGTLTLFADGTYARDTGDPGRWRFDGEVLVLDWKNWGAEQLFLRGEGRFEAQNGFTLTRRGARRPPGPKAPLPPEPEAPARRCGAGPDDPGCGWRKNGVLPLDEDAYLGLLEALKSEANELSRRDLVLMIAGPNERLTALQLGPILELFTNELTRLEVAQALAPRLVNPKAALRHAALFRNSFSRRDFVEAMTRQSSTP